MSLRIWIRRAYEPPSKVDGYRVLIDRIWPRGVTKSALQIDRWSRDLAPSDELRRWFGHDPKRWPEFHQRYVDELAAASEPEKLELDDLIQRARAGRVTLVFGAHDAAHSNAVVLREVLTENLGGRSSDKD